MKEKTDDSIGKKRSIPFVCDADWDVFCETKRKYNLTWKNVFSRFSAYMNGIEYIFAAPPKLTNQIKLDLNTVMALTSMWIDNVSNNFMKLPHPDIKEFFRSGEFKGCPAITIAAGPSLHNNKHLEALAKSDFQKNGGKIFTCAHALADVLHAGIVPDVCSVVDGHNLMMQFFKDPIVDEYADKITMIFIASTDNEVYTNWKGDDCYLFHSGVPDNLIPNVDMFLETMLRGMTMVDTGGNSGTANCMFASLAGCNPVASIGLDLSYPEGYPYEKTQYYHAYLSSVGIVYKDAKEMIDKCYKAYGGVHPTWGNRYYYDFVNDVFINAFKDLSKRVIDAYGTEVINCTEGGAVYGDHIKCMTLKEFL